MPDIQEWCDALLRKTEGVTTNSPPQSLINRLENRALKSATSQASRFSESVITATSNPPVINNIYTIDHRDRPRTPKNSTATLPASSPIFVEGDVCHDDVLWEYGFWHEQRVRSQEWKDDIWYAVRLCQNECLRLDYARKKLLSWWIENGVKEGIARMFCDDVRIFKKEKERGWAKPQVTIRQRFSDWMDGTMETRSFVSAVHSDADGVVEDNGGAVDYAI